MAKRNPIIPGFAPDPSVVRVGDEYFLVNSSFHFFPGLPVYASKDLVSWRHIGNALNRPEQIPLSRTPSKLSMWAQRELMVGNRGLYAPTIRHHQGKYYIICTNVEGEVDAQEDTGDHFIISTADIYSNQWSDPVHFDFNGGDPSLYFEDGHVYVQIGHAPDFAIYQFEIDIETGKKLSTPTEIWKDSGRKWTESPHIYKRNGCYYLLMAEAGTFERHMISVARSANLWGPYEGHPDNPILTALGTSNYIQHVGHGDFVEDMQGDWWMVCLGVRKRDDRFVLGRETFLTPVEWPDEFGWPNIRPITMDVIDEETKDRTLPPLENGEIDAVSKIPGFIYIRDYDPKSYKISAEGPIILYPSLSDLSASHGAVTFVGKRQRSLEGKVSAKIGGFFDAGGDSASKIRAGLAIYKEELRYFRIFYDAGTRQVWYEALNRGQEFYEVVKTDVVLTEPVTLSINFTELSYEFSYRLTPDGNNILLGTLDAKRMTNLDFVGPVVGVFAAGEAEGGQAVHVTDFHVD